MTHLLKPLVLALLCSAGVAQADVCTNPVGGNVFFNIDTLPLNASAGNNLSVQQLCVTGGDAANGYSFTNSFNIGSTGIDISGSFKTDPYINWVVTAVNNSAATYGFSAEILIPINGGPFSGITTGFTAALTDQHGDGVFVFGPNAQIELNLANVPELNLGPGLGVPCEFGPGIAGANYSCGTFSASKVLSQSFTSLDANIGFILSGGSDVATFTGATVIDYQSRVQDVPEPGSLALLALGLGVAGWARRKSGAQAN